MPFHKNKILPCDHDFKNAIKYSEVDYICPKCGNFIDPFEWFLATNFNVVNCTPKSVMKKMENNVKISIKEEKNYIKQLNNDN